MARLWVPPPCPPPFLDKWNPTVFLFTDRAFPTSHVTKILRVGRKRWPLISQNPPFTLSFFSLTSVPTIPHFPLGHFFSPVDKEVGFVCGWFHLLVSFGRFSATLPLFDGPPPSCSHEAHSIDFFAQFYLFISLPLPPPALQYFNCCWDMSIWAIYFLAKQYISFFFFRCHFSAAGFPPLMWPQAPF